MIKLLEAYARWVAAGVTKYDILWGSFLWVLIMVCCYFLVPGHL